MDGIIDVKTCPCDLMDTEVCTPLRCPENPDLTPGLKAIFGINGNEENSGSPRLKQIFGEYHSNPDGPISVSPSHIKRALCHMGITDMIFVTKFFQAVEETRG